GRRGNQDDGARLVAAARHRPEAGGGSVMDFREAYLIGVRAGLLAAERKAEREANLGRERARMQLAAGDDEAAGRSDSRAPGCLFMAERIRAIDPDAVAQEIKG